MMGSYGSKRRVPKAPFVVTIAALAAACGGNAFSGGSGGSAGSAGDAGSAGSGTGGSGGSAGSSGSSGSAGTGGQSQCPTSAPGSGTSCAGFAGGICEYDPCQFQPSLFECQGGVWVATGSSSCNPPPPFECPPTEPLAGSACYGDGSEGVVCSYDYGPCCPPDEARCVNGFWEIMGVDCNPPPPDPCPIDAPLNGAACGSMDECANPYRTCDYGDCGGSGQPEFAASCDGSVWTITSNCMTVDAGFSDAGSSVDGASASTDGS